jgi:hypothetical protein
LTAADVLHIDTGQTELAGVQLAHIRSESDAVVHTAESMRGSIPGTDAGLGIGAAVTDMAEAWSAGFDQIGHELELLGGKVQQAAKVYVLVEDTAVSTFTGHGAI